MSAALCSSAAAFSLYSVADIVDWTRLRNIQQELYILIAICSIVSQLASLLDLNSLHNLSRTCRQFRVNLLQFRDQLVTQSLRCSKEDLQRGEALAARLRESRMIWRTSGPEAREWQGHRITSGKVGKCARDMVGECRRCGTIVCRVRLLSPPRRA